MAKDGHDLDKSQALWLKGRQTETTLNANPAVVGAVALIQSWKMKEILNGELRHGGKVLWLNILARHRGHITDIGYRGALQIAITSWSENARYAMQVA